MDYLEQAKKEIREDWFKNHKIQSITGEQGFQRIVWGRDNSSFYQVNYVFSGRMLFISGDLGEAVYALTWQGTPKSFEDVNLGYFMEKLTAHSRERWVFDDAKARKEINEYFEDWSCGEKLSPELTNLKDELLEETHEWSDTDSFQRAVYAIYRDNDVEWFDAETAWTISECGRKLKRSFIAYLVGLKMIAELLEKKEVVKA